MKTAGLILLFAFCTLFGFAAAFKQKMKADYSDMSYQLLCRLRMLLRYSHPEKNVLFDQLSEEGYGALLNDDGVNSDGVISDILSEYLSKLGTRDLEGELEALDFTIGSVKSRMDVVRQSTAQNCRLFISLGILAGTFAVIIFV